MLKDRYSDDESSNIDYRSSDTAPVIGSAGMKFAELLRPRSLSEVLGQQHILSKTSVLRRSIETGTFDSLIFVGPPGTGKTTVARIAGDILAMPFHSLHATTAGSNELKKISDSATKTGVPALVFIDEIHRYNKTQQNMLLKLIDDRLIKLVSASTENPTYALMPAFRSRSFIFNFKPVSAEELLELVIRAEEIIKTHFNVSKVDISDVIDDLIRESAGDARRFLNMLELSTMLAARDGDTLTLSTDGMDELISQRRFDDDEYYDILSAMIKSIRGSDPDAALLWGLKLVKSGVSPEEVFRRLLISCSEDIGNAYPEALIFVESAYSAFMKVGLPEGMIILSHVLTYVASYPKSNRSYRAYKRCDEYLDNNDPVVPTNVSHEAVGYKNPHDYGGFVEQLYKSDDVSFYEPSNNGYEAKIAERLKRLWRK